MRLEELSENLQYLISEDIRTHEEMEKRMTDLGNERKAVQSELSSVETQLYRSELCRLLMKRDRLKSGGWLDAEDEKELDRIDEQIQKIMPIDQAFAYRDSLLKQKEECRSQMRDIRQKEKLFANLDREFDDAQKDIPSQRELEELAERMKEEAQRRTYEMNRKKEWVQKQERTQKQGKDHSRAGTEKAQKKEEGKWTRKEERRQI